MLHKDQGRQGLCTYETSEVIDICSHMTMNLGVALFNILLSNRIQIPKFSTIVPRHHQDVPVPII